jgi:valine--pyruvate aminotransferase
MRAFTTRFAERMTRPTGALELMADLGAALAQAGKREIHMLGGGNPARIPAVEAVYRRRLAEIAADTAQFGRFIAGYSAPEGDLPFRQAVAQSLHDQYGWNLTAANVGLTGGSQAAFFFLFNLMAGERADGGRSRLLLPLAPEYIGYADVGLTPGTLVAQPARIRDLDSGFFKYCVDFDRLQVPDDIGAICISRPTNPSGNVLTLAELERLDALARSRDVPLIIDAAYGMPFPGIQHDQFAALWNSNVVLCLSLSKLGLPAARTGIVVADEAIIAALAAFNATAALAPPSTGPVIVEPLLRNGELAALCRDHIRPHYATPEGAFFLWLWFPGLPIGSEELYRRLKRRNVLVLSGHHFFPGVEHDDPHQRECLRLSYAQPPASVQAGISVLAEEVRRAYERG